jgi:hypothetical protein
MKVENPRIQTILDHIETTWRTSRVSRLFLLYNGLSVRLLSMGKDLEPVSSSASSPPYVRIALDTCRDFFSQGTAAAITEINISREAIDTIGEAIQECHSTPVPLVRALSELLNACLSGAGSRGISPVPGQNTTRALCERPWSGRGVTVV